LVADWSFVPEWVKWLNWHRDPDMLRSLGRRMLDQAEGSDTLRYIVSDTLDTRLWVSLMTVEGNRRNFPFDLKILDNDPKVSLRCLEGPNADCLAGDTAFRLEASWTPTFSGNWALSWHWKGDTANAVPWISAGRRSIGPKAGMDTVDFAAPDSMEWLAVKAEIVDTLTGKRDSVIGRFSRGVEPAFRLPLPRVSAPARRLPLPRWQAQDHPAVPRMRRRP
jgi:hypothetical protein